jgi:hypothetical protein
MASAAVNGASRAGRLEFPQSFHEPLWYVAYTSANHEKRVAEQFDQWNTSCRCMSPCAAGRTVA